MAAFPPHFVWALILNKELSVMGGGKISTGAADGSENDVPGTI